MTKEKKQTMNVMTG